MNIFNPGNAFCICVSKSHAVKFIVDPWILSKAFHDGWIAPVFTTDKNSLFQQLGKIDFILVTHIHEDHFDINFLALFAGTPTKIVFPKVFGWKYFSAKVSSVGLSDNLILVDPCQTVSFDCITVTALPPFNTALVLDSDSVSNSPISIDGGFLVSERFGSKVAFMADNNPYNVDQILKHINLFEDINVFCISHNGFASDYPFQYGYSQEECFAKYEQLENSRQTRQLNHIKDLIQPDSILAYSSSFVPNSWVNPNWWYCARYSNYFDSVSAAAQFEVISGIKSFGLSLDTFLDCSNLSVERVSNNRYLSSIKKYMLPAISQLETASVSSCSQVTCESVPLDARMIDASIQNYYNKAAEFCLEPQFKIQINVDNMPPILLEYLSNRPGHLLKMSMSASDLASILLGSLHWNSAMLSFRIDAKRQPDFYCAHTYDSLLNFTQPRNRQ